MKNLLADIPFESLDAEVIRNLCGHAIGTMTTTDADGSMASIVGLDYRIPAIIRLNTNHGNTSFWSRFSNNKDAVVQLLKMYVEMKSDRPSRYMFLEQTDAIPEVALHPEVVSCFLDNRDIFIGPGFRLSGIFPIFGKCRGHNFYSAFVNNRAQIASLAALMPHVMAPVQASAVLTSEQKMEFHKTVVGFLHKWNNDSLDALRGIVEITTSECAMSASDFDSLMLHLCRVCRKDEANMKRIKDDLSHDRVGGKASRRRDAGWLTRYIKRSLDAGKTELVKEIVQCIPPVMALVPSKVRASKDFRSLKRLYQISGDYE